jgi:2-C-methyl-D-erythritol 2,4-cyclodiphosphate synthase
MGIPVRIGQGFDVHAFMDGDHVILGGVRIPHTHGLKAHSDGDVVLHALVDSMLGAGALGDIGTLFPDSDPAFKNQDSRYFVRIAVERLREIGWKPHNVDVTVIAEKPRMGPYALAIKENIAKDLDLPLASVNVKATTTESLGFCGRKEGIAAMAICTLEQYSNDKDNRAK